MTMKYIDIGKSGLMASQISLGCMRLKDVSSKEVETLLSTSIDLGINFFDHADIYGDGECETIFAAASKNISLARDKIIIQSKCGIRKGFFDFSKEHIINSTDAILKRLNTDYLDTLLLHRPDTLMEMDEVAEAFTTLKQSGKVRKFGVSNQNPSTIDLLQKYIKDKLIINQLQFSLTNTGMIDSGLNVNMQNSASVNRDGGILEYCRLHDITIQPWSPFQYGFFEGIFIGNEKFPKLNSKMEELASKYNISLNAMAIAWILRHPAQMQPVVGTTNVSRLKDIAKASNVVITREEWYELYCSAGNVLP